MCLQVYWYGYIGYLSRSSHKWQIPIPTTLFKEQGGRVTRLRGDSFILSHSACILVLVYNLELAVPIIACSDTPK